MAHSNFLKQAEHNNGIKVSDASGSKAKSKFYKNGRRPPSVMGVDRRRSQLVDDEELKVEMNATAKVEPRENESFTSQESP
jgi:hypothetical protein